MATNITNPRYQAQEVEQKLINRLQLQTKPKKAYVKSISFKGLMLRHQQLKKATHTCPAMD